MSDTPASCELRCTRLNWPDQSLFPALWVHGYGFLVSGSPGALIERGPEFVTRLYPTLDKKSEIRLVMSEAASASYDGRVLSAK